MEAQPKKTTIFRLVFLMPRYCLMFIIKLYQLTFSPDHGLFKHRFPNGYCPFYPSCSSYAYQTIEKNGAIRGSLKSVWRIVRCHPWTRGGVDMP